MSELQNRNEQILADWMVMDVKNKTKLGKKYGVSPRTIGRVVDEYLNYAPAEAVKDVTWDYCVTKSEITLIKDGSPRTITKEFFKFNTLKSDLIVAEFSDEIMAEVYDKMCMKKVIDTFSEGNLTVDYENSKIMYGTFEVKNSLVGHIFKMLEKGDNVLPMVRFLDKLMENPKKDIVDELYGFMKHNNISIHEDGDIIAFKGVTYNYLDKWTKTIDNSVGCSPKMPRHEVEYNPSTGCGRGLHTGALDYATSWAGSDGHVMVTKINPRDVVSVPYDCDGAKMRTCGYIVIDEVNK